MSDGSLLPHAARLGQLLHALHRERGHFFYRRSCVYLGRVERDYRWLPGNFQVVSYEVAQTSGPAREVRNGYIRTNYFVVKPRAVQAAIEYGWVGVG